MAKHLLVGVLIGLLAGAGCGGPALIVRNDRGKTAMVDLHRVCSVEYGKADLQMAMGLFAEHVAALIQRQHQLRLLLASADPIAEAYLRWCARRGEPGDCLSLLGGAAPGLSNDAKRTTALRMGLAVGLQEAGEIVRNINPVKVEALMVIWFTIYLATLVFPDATVTKALFVIMTANLIAFLGVDGFRNIIQGYRDMVKEADTAQTFSKLQEAGERYGRRMGPSMVRIVTALATWGLSAATGMARPVTDLPGGAQAVVNAEVQGFHLLAIRGGSVAVSASGTVSLAVLSEAAVPENSGGAGDQQSTTKTAGQATTTPSAQSSKLGPLKRFEIDKYGRFNSGCRVGDDLCGHEVLQNSWLREHGYAARLFEDRHFSQWGLVLVSPERALELTDRMHRDRARDSLPGDLVVGEFLGDSDLLIVRANPEAADYGSVLVALPLDSRRDWYRVGARLADFLRSYASADGAKFWETQKAQP